MHSNQKLTKLIAGRSVSSASQAAGLLTIAFDDGSILQVKTAPANTKAVAVGGKVSKVRQQGTGLALDLEGGGSIEIELAEAASSVLLRDKAGKLEYAD